MRYELLLLTKSGREITVGLASSETEAQQLGGMAQQLLGSLKEATEQNQMVHVNAEGTIYWLLPTEIEGMSLFRVEDE